MKTSGANIGERFFLSVYAKVRDALGIMGNIDNRELKGFSYLRSSKPDTMGIIHGLDHVFGKRADLVRHIGDEIAYFSQHGVRIENNRSDHGRKDTPEYLTLPAECGAVDLQFPGLPDLPRPTPSPSGRAVRLRLLSTQVGHWDSVAETAGEHSAIVPL